MFGVGFFEIVVIIVFALVFIGPKGLPDLMRKLGRLFVYVRRMSNDVKRQFEDVIREAELEMEHEKVQKIRELLRGKNIISEELQETVNIINSSTASESITTSSTSPAQRKISPQKLSSENRDASELADEINQISPPDTSAQESLDPEDVNDSAIQPNHMDFNSPLESPHSSVPIKDKE